MILGVPAESETPPREPGSSMPLTRQPACPKHMVFGPCGGVRADLSCEMVPHRCPFTEGPVTPDWTDPTPTQSSQSRLLEAARTGPVVVTDLTLPAYDADAVTGITAVLAGS